MKELSYNSDFEGIFRDLEILDRKLMQTFQKEIDTIMESIKNGKMKGSWRVKEIDEPNSKGFIIQGRFGSEDTFEPLEPMKPYRPKPLPENPFVLSRKTLNETREPLTDIFDEGNAIKIYVELPGEEETDIKVNTKEGQIEIKARGFAKMIDLPKASLAMDGMTSSYKNGVLQIAIPKKKELREKDSRKTKLV